MPATKRPPAKAAAPTAKRILAKPAKVATAQRTAKTGDEARFEAWLKDFDVRQAQLSAQLDAVLYSLGVNPERETA